MYPQSHLRAATVAEAVAALRADEDAKLLAGGQTLIPTLKQRLAAPSKLIDLSAAAELRGIRRDDEAIVVGAMTRHAEVAASEIVATAIPALADLAGRIGDRQVRNMGTLGGSIANADPAADYPAALLGLNATVVTDRRRIAADDFLTGMFETALEPDEVVTEVAFPIPRAAAYAKFPNPASRYAVVGVFIAMTGTGPRVAVTGAADFAFRMTEMEAALTVSLTASALEGVEISADGLNADIHAGADYRAHLIGVMAKRALAALG